MPSSTYRQKIVPRAALAVVIAASGLVVPATLASNGSKAAAEVSTAPAEDSAAARLRAEQSGERIEDLSQRNETTQFFANPDGTWTAEQAAEPVRVQDGGGDWHDVDLTLVERDGALEPRYGSADVRLSNGGDKVMAEFSSENKDLAWKWPDTLPTPDVDGDTATYADVVPGGDLVVTATQGGFSHSIVLRERPDSDVVYSLPVITDGAKLTETPSGGLEVATASGEVVVEAPRPLMWDAARNAQGDPTNVEPVDVAVTKPGNLTPEGETAGSSPVMTLTATEDFLSDPTTVYPVTIDPTFSEGTGGDTWVQNLSQGGNQGTSIEVRAGTYDGGTHLARTYMKFYDPVWYGLNVTSARIVMRNWSSANCNTGSIQLARVTSEWAFADIEWTNQPSASGTNLAVFGTPFGGTTGTCPAQGDAIWNVTNMVKDWQAGAGNYGVRIGAVDSTSSNTWRRYRSANYADTSLKPRLEITYVMAPSVPQQSIVPCLNPCQSDYYATDTTTPTLRASSTDGDGSPMFFVWQIRSDNSPDVIHTAGTNPVLSEQAEYVVPAGILSDEATYEWRVKATNSVSTTASPWTALTVDVAQAPNSPDALQLTPCNDACTSLVATSVAPTLVAAISDNDSELLAAKFEIRQLGQSQLLGSNEVLTSSGSTASWTLPSGLLHDGFSYQFRVIALDETSETASAWTQMAVAVPAGVQEPSQLSLDTCQGPCEDWVSSSASPSFRATNPAGNGSKEVRFELKSGTYTTAQAVPAVAPGGNATWTTASGVLAAGSTFEIRAGTVTAGEIRWSGWRTGNVSSDATGSSALPLAEEDPADLSAPVPDASLDTEDQTTFSQSAVDAEMAAIDAAVQEDDVASLARGASRYNDPQRIVPKAAQFAPYVYLHPDEKLWPMSAGSFIEHSTLKWEHLCGSHKITPDPSPSRLGGNSSGPYIHSYGVNLPSPYTGGCSELWDRPTLRASTDDVKSGGSGDDGMVLNLDNNYKDGNGFQKKEPIYYRQSSYLRNDGLFGTRIVYWFPYGASNTAGFEHEGDWERIGIQFNPNGVPEKVAYNAHKGGCSLPWSKAPRTSTEHVKVWAGKGTHGSYPPYEKAVNFRYRGITFSDSISGDGPIWKPVVLKNVTAVSWYGFGGNWGNVGDIGETTGPSGPSPYKTSASWNSKPCVKKAGTPGGANY